MSDALDLLEGKLKGTLESFLQGTDADIQNFARKVSRNLLVAAATGSERDLAAAQAQVPLLLELNQLRLVDLYEDAFFDIIELFLSAAFTAARIPSIK